MTVAAINAYSGPYAPNGATTSFPFTFQAKSAEEVAVQIDGIPVTTGFSVSLNSDGTGSVDFDIAPAASAGDDLIVYSDPLFAQTISFENAGAFQPRTHDVANDRAAIRDVYLRDRIRASIRAPFGETMTALPLLASRAGLFLAFDAEGNPVASAGTGSDANLRSDLAASSGSALAGFLQGGVSAAARSVQAKLREIVSIADFGAVGDGVIDDTTAVQAAIDSLGASGGTVTVPHGMRVLVDNNLTIKPNVSLVGPHAFTGSPQDNTSAPYGSVGGALLVNSTKTITLKGGASLQGLLIHRKGMAFPASDSSAFAGTAVTIGGDDAAVSHCMILGFNKGVYATGFQRLSLTHLRMDNLNGVEITSCYDVSALDRVHCWPFATIASYAVTPTPAKLQRNGTAFYLHDVADWTKLTSCFAFGYARAYDIVAVNTATLVNCSADGTSGADVYAGCRGFSVRGNSVDTKFIGCNASSQEIGFYIATTGANPTHAIGCVSASAGTGGDHAFFVDTGNLSVVGGTVYSHGNGFVINSVNSRVSIDGGFTFGAGLANPIQVTVAVTTDKLRIGHAIFSGVADGTNIIVGAGTLRPLSIASAADLVLPATGNEFQVTGTTNIATLSEGWAGRQVTLFFSGVLTVTHGTATADAMRLSGAANFVTTAGATLTLRHNGVQWFEIGRAA